MIEELIRKELAKKLSVPVRPEKGVDLKGEYVLFEKTGSGRKNGLMSSTFAFQSYSTSLYKTIKLNEKVKTAVDSLIELDEIAGIRLNTDYNFTDTTTKEYRYQAVYDISHY